MLVSLCRRSSDVRGLRNSSFVYLGKFFCLGGLSSINDRVLLCVL